MSARLRWRSRLARSWTRRHRTRPRISTATACRRAEAGTPAPKVTPAPTRPGGEVSYRVTEITLPTYPYAAHLSQTTDPNAGRLPGDRARSHRVRSLQPAARAHEAPADRAGESLPAARHPARPGRADLRGHVQTHRQQRILQQPGGEADELGAGESRPAPTGGWGPAAWGGTSRWRSTATSSASRGASIT